MRQKTLFLAYFLLSLNLSAQDETLKESKPTFEWYKKGRNSFGGMIWPASVGNANWNMTFEFEYSRFIMDQLSLNLNNTIDVRSSQLDFEYDLFARYHLTKSKLSPFVQAGYSFGFGGTESVGYYDNAAIFGAGLSYMMCNNRLSLNLMVGPRFEWSEFNSNSPVSEWDGASERSRNDVIWDGSFTIKYHF